MKIMVIGSGGREHAILAKLAESPEKPELFALPGNGGMTELARCVPISATDLPGICDFAVREGIGFAVVTPDDPLAMGMVDALESRGVPCFGPTKAAARIESSKLFSKALMERYGIPTARYRRFDRMDAALAYIGETEPPMVVKADGLALGKGVTVAMTREEAAGAVRELMEGRRFGESGARILIEEYLTGPEVSVLCFTDGKTLCPMVSAMDHKRVGDGDVGPNTGGMGAIAPNPYYTADMAELCMETIFLPTVRAMAAEGCPFKGCLYFGLMLTKDGPKVIEYNCRFGDPETQAVLPLLTSDLLTILRAVREERLDQVPVTFSKDCACCVVLASQGYPGKYETGKPISFSETEALVFHAGTRLENGRCVTAGGRVLGVTALGKTAKEARENAYRAVDGITFPGAYCRRDIGTR